MSGAAPLVVLPCRLPADYARYDDLARAVAEGGIGGLLVFGGDLDLTPRFLRRLREAAGADLLVMSDVERGVGQQVEGCLRLPPPMAMGALRDPAAAYALGAATAVECRRVGFDVALAPVLDLYVEPTNPILGPRSFGADPDLVGALGAAWIEGCQDEGVLACAKHFPGHGRTTADSHDALPVVEASERELERDLAPFRAAVAAGVATAMTAHVAYPHLRVVAGEDAGLPATLRCSLVDGLLRSEIGFQGLVMTDALLMEGVRTGRGEGAAAVASLAAGCDLLLCPTSAEDVLPAVEEALRKGILPWSRLDAALARRNGALDRLRARPTAREIGGMDEYRAYAMAAAATTVLRDARRVLPLRRRPGGLGLAIVLDDDDRPGREAPLHEQGGAFPGGILRATPGTAADRGDLQCAAASADFLLLAVYGDTRAWKGRAGLDPALDRLRGELEAAAPHRTVTVVFGSPALAGAGGPAAAVCAWDDAPVLQRAALDLLLEGRVPTGRRPFGPDPLG